MVKATGDGAILGSGRYRGVVVALAVLVVFATMSLWFPLRYSPEQPDFSNVLRPPSEQHWFGTDIAGFDIFTRTVWSTRIDLPLAISGNVVAMIVGVGLGLVAGMRGRHGELIMRGLDAFQAFPLLILAVAIVALSGQRLESVVIAIAVVNAPKFVRLVRNEALHLRETKYVEFAMAMSATRRRILFRHILPNTSGVILAQFSLGVADAVIVIASLSFLGVGLGPPATSWGAMIQDGSTHIATGVWWGVAFPALGITIAVALLNFVGNRLGELWER